MDKARFIEQFITTFCATYMAQHYDDTCMRGWTDENNKPPVEDAESLAEHAWDALVEHNQRYGTEA